jgi:capsular exopolysaccharide synthesis family protein
LESRYGKGYTKVGELKTQLKQLDSAIGDEVRNVGKRLEDEYQVSAKTEAMIRRQFDDQKAQAYQLNEHVAQYAILKHEVESSSALYDTLELKLKEAAVGAGLSSGYISIVDRGLVPAKPIAPKKNLNLMLGLLGGLGGGLMLAFILDSLDDTLRTTDDLEQLALPALGAIPLITDGMTPMSNKGAGSPRLPASQSGPVAFEAPRSQVAEAIRAVRTSLLLSSIDRQPKVLVVTSSVPGEGKSTVSSNLAVSLAQRGERVLLVDADLRRSTVHQKFGMRSAAKGLSTLLSTGKEDGAVLTPIQELPNLKILPAGPHPPAPAEALASRRMGDLIDEWRTQYDHVIIDTSPLLPVADTLTIAAKADGVAIVVRSGLSRIKAVQRTRGLLLRAGAHIFGAVVNGVDMRLEYYRAYPTRYGYTTKYGMGYYDNEQA